MDRKHLFIGAVLCTLLASCSSGAFAQDLQQPASVVNAWLDHQEGEVVPTSANEPQPASPLSDAPLTSVPCAPGLCCNLCPCTYAQVEALFWERSSHPDRTVLINANNQQALVSTSDLDFGFDPGIRALFGFHLCNGQVIEFGYFGLFESQASLDYVRPNTNIDVTLPGALGVATNVFHDGVQTRTEYISRLQGAEVNLPCCCCWESPCGDVAGSREWFAGFRYVNLQESFRINGAKPVGGGVETGYYDLSSRNDLFGAQIGARIRRARGRFGWEATGKAGIFGNQAGQEQVVMDYPDFPLRPEVSSNGACVAFLGELNLTGIYQLNRTWGLRAGYNLMWIEGLALAPNQMDFTFTSISGTGLNTAGGLFLHGVNLGLEARW